MHAACNAPSRSNPFLLNVSSARSHLTRGAVTEKQYCIPAPLPQDRELPDAAAAAAAAAATAAAAGLSLDTGVELSRRRVVKLDNKKEQLAFAGMVGLIDFDYPRKSSQKTTLIGFKGGRTWEGGNVAREKWELVNNKIGE